MDQRVIWRHALCLCQHLLKGPPVLHKVQVEILRAIIVPLRLSFLSRHCPSDFAACLLVFVLSVNYIPGPDPCVELLSSPDCEVVRHLESSCGQERHLQSGQGVVQKCGRMPLESGWQTSGMTGNLCRGRPHGQRWGQDARLCIDRTFMH